MPLDRGLIDQQLQDLGEGSRWWDVRELRDLPAVLHEDERILALSRGKVARVRWLRRSWLVVVTDQRLVCLRSDARSSWRQFEVPADQITRVTLRIGPLRGRVLVVASGRKYRMLVPRADAHRLLSALSLFSAAGTRSVAGFTPARMVRQVIDHMLALPAVALDPGSRPALPAATADTSRIEERLDALEEHVQGLTKQVEFLQQLLEERHAASPQESAAAGE